MDRTGEARCWIPLVLCVILPVPQGGAQDANPCLKTQPCNQSGSAGQTGAATQAAWPATVNCHGTHGLAVFKEPGAINIIGTLACGQTVEVLKTGIGRDSRVAEVRSKEAQDGYVYQTFLDLQAPASPSGTTAPEPLTNESILRLVSAGLGEGTIVTMVNTQPGKYSVGTDDVVALKKAGVSEKIITAMIESAARAPSPAPANSVDSVPTAKVPDDPGLYAVMSDGAPRHTTGRPTSFVRTGSLLASGATAGIHARRINTQIAGESAYVTVGPKATFYYRVAPNAPDQVVPGTLSLILTEMTVKPGRRQFELDASGILRRTQGLSVRHQSNFDVQELGPNSDPMNSSRGSMHSSFSSPGLRVREKPNPPIRARMNARRCAGSCTIFRLSKHWGRASKGSQRR